MKIKAVCEQTGLTDRTVRFYIEEGLLSPSYTENYLGRKSFEFQAHDVALLTQIATLRRFDFSIEEIRQIIREPKSAASIIESVKTRISHALAVDQRKIAVLSSIKVMEAYTLSALAEALSLSEEKGERVDTEKSYHPSCIIGVLRAIVGFLAVWLPLLLGIGVPVVDALTCKAPIVSPMRLFVVGLLLVPSLLILLSERAKGLRSHKAKPILWGACLCSVALCAMLSFGVVRECEHDWLVAEQLAPATCTAEGKALNVCGVCQRNEIEVLQRISHCEVIDAAVAATCVHQGTTEGRHCSACEIVTLAQRVLPQLSHTYAKSVQKASCGEDGFVLLACDCGDRRLQDHTFATEAHRFVKNGEKGELGFYCTECSLEVCEYGYADGTPYGNSSAVQYYITGRIDPKNEIDRTLVIYGSGEMPSAITETGCHPWRMSAFLEEVCQIVICEGITSIAEGAFSEIHDRDIWMGNPFFGVQSFLVKGDTLQINAESVDMSGILCEITYLPKNTNYKE